MRFVMQSVDYVKLITLPVDQKITPTPVEGGLWRVQLDLEPDVHASLIKALEETQ